MNKDIYSRKIFSYMSIEQKKKFVEYQKKEIEKLELELQNNAHLFSDFIKNILIDTYDKWNLETDELELDIKKENKIEWHGAKKV